MEEELAAKPEAGGNLRHKRSSSARNHGFGRARFRKLLVVGEVAFS